MTRLLHFPCIIHGTILLSVLVATVQATTSSNKISPDVPAAGKSGEFLLDDVVACTRESNDASLDDDDLCV